MRVFVTGATGWIGSAVVGELLESGHQVLGLARSDESAAALAQRGVDVLRGSLEDLDSLRAGAADAEGVIHTAYIHDFSRMEDAANTDVRVIEAFGEVLEGTGRPLVFTTGVALVAPGRLATEEDRSNPNIIRHPRALVEPTAFALAEKGVRPIVVRPGASVHGAGDHGFVSVLVQTARAKGISAYIGDGTNRWPAVHRFDTATLYRLGLDSAPAGSILHAVAENVPTREIAEAIGRQLDVPVVSVAPEQAAEHFAWLGQFFALDAPASSELTQRLLGWKPTHPGLIEDLNQSYYFEQAPAPAA